FNSYQFSACRMLIQSISERLASDERRRFEVLDILAEGYEAWDRFNHKHGLNRLEKGLVELRKLVDLRAEGFLTSLTGGLANNVEFLRRLKQNTQDFHELHPLLL